MALRLAFWQHVQLLLSPSFPSRIEAWQIKIVSIQDVAARWAASGTCGFGFDRLVLLCVGRFGVGRRRCLFQWHRLPRATHAPVWIKAIEGSVVFSPSHAEESCILCVLVEVFYCVYLNRTGRRAFLLLRLAEVCY